MTKKDTKKKDTTGKKGTKKHIKTSKSSKTKNNKPSEIPKTSEKTNETPELSTKKITLFEKISIKETETLVPTGDKPQKEIKATKGKKGTKAGKALMVLKDEDVDLRPYREIVLSDGHGFFIKTTCNLTSDDRVQVVQYREHSSAEGMKFACTEPVYFENKSEFLEWIMETLKHNFDKIPYITITPIDSSEIKKHEREARDTMYM